MQQLPWGCPSEPVALESTLPLISLQQESIWGVLALLPAEPAPEGPPGLKWGVFVSWYCRSHQVLGYEILSGKQSVQFPL